MRKLSKKVMRVCGVCAEAAVGLKAPFRQGDAEAVQARQLGERGGKHESVSVHFKLWNEKYQGFQGGHTLRARVCMCVWCETGSSQGGCKSLGIVSPKLGGFQVQVCVLGLHVTHVHMVHTRRQSPCSATHHTSRCPYLIKVPPFSCPVLPLLRRHPGLDLALDAHCDLPQSRVLGGLPAGP